MRKQIIAHIMMESPFRVGMGYQENYLSSKHKELGYDVHVISTSCGISLSHKAEYCQCTQDGINIHYLEINNSLLRRLPFVVGWIHTSIGLPQKLEEIKPDIIFVHGICKIDNIDIIKYCKVHSDVKLFVDNHSDFYNTPVNSFRAKSFRYGVGRYLGSKFNIYAQRIWGVSPWRVAYQQKVYGITTEKSGLLVMGGDEAKINWESRSDIKEKKRKEFNIPNSSFVIVTGGKIDKTKNIHLLLNALVQHPLDDIHIFVFGKFEKDMLEYSKTLTDKRIHFVGWITPDLANDYFLAADLACFPGTHSVLWEQACACGVPAIFKDWNGGFSHVDIGGNCIFLKDISEVSLYITIQNLIIDTDKYEKMKEVAQTKARKTFSYIEIAKRSIEI